jgi:hypothetical protein
MFRHLGNIKITSRRRQIDDIDHVALSPLNRPPLVEAVFKGAEPYVGGYLMRRAAAFQVGEIFLALACLIGPDNIWKSLAVGHEPGHPDSNQHTPGRSNCSQSPALG